MLHRNVCHVRLTLTHSNRGRGHVSLERAHSPILYALSLRFAWVSVLIFISPMNLTVEYAQDFSICERKSYQFFIHIDDRYVCLKYHIRSDTEEKKIYPGKLSICTSDPPTKLDFILSLVPPSFNSI